MAEGEGRQKGRREFTREFKLEALKRLAAKEKPATQLAAELGVRRNMLVKWREQLRLKGEAAFSGRRRPAKGEQSELVRLRAELQRMTEEHDILKKAAAYFAKRRR